MLTVHEPESVSELPLEDAMLIKTYQLAITGSRRAGKKIVKMILEREKLRFKRRALRSPRIASQIEKDPKNALEALEILGIASRRANTNDGDSRDGRLRLERWAVEAALRRRNFDELSSSDIQSIRGWTHDGHAVKWPRSFLDRGTPGLDQLALATLIQSGRYDRHLRRMRGVYARRRGALVEALARGAPAVRLTGLAAGFHAVAHLPDQPGEQAVIAAARARSVGLYGMASTAPPVRPRPLSWCWDSAT